MRIEILLDRSLASPLRPLFFAQPVPSFLFHKKNNKTTQQPSAAITNSRALKQFNSTQKERDGLAGRAVGAAADDVELVPRAVDLPSGRDALGKLRAAGRGAEHGGEL
jgi:hypothetical protein